MNRKTVGIILGGLLLGGGFVFMRQAKSTAYNKESGENIEKAVVVKKSIGSETVFLKKKGVIQGEKEVYLSPKASGRVSQIYVKMGDHVRKNQTLAVIDGSEMIYQSKIALAGFDLARKASKKTREYFENQISQAKKARDLAKDAYDYAKNSGDENEIAKAKANYELAKKAVKVAESGGNLQISVARGKKDVAKNQLNLSDLMVDNTRLKAPFSGTIAKVEVEVGDMVSPERPMFLLIGDNGKEIQISVSLKELKSIDKEGEVKISSENKSAIGHISEISSVIDTHTRKGLVKIILDQDSNQFSLGEYVNVLLPQKNNNEGGIFIPQEALVNSYYDKFVFVVEDGIAKRKKVSIENISDKYMEVRGDLSVNEDIVVQGQQYLNDGDKVKVN